MSSEPSRSHLRQFGERCFSMVAFDSSESAKYRGGTDDYTTIVDTAIPWSIRLKNPRS